MKPSTLGEYLEQTEFVVKHSFEGLDRIQSVYSEARSHWNMSRIGEEETEELRRDRDRYLELAKAYFGLKLSEGILCGGILQVGHTAIRQFSNNDVIPDYCASIAKIEHAKRFCIGRRIDSLPLGLILYAARNQWAHWEEEELRDPARAVFSRLAAAHHADPLWDLALDLSNPTINVHANEVVIGLLGWKSYEDYERDVRAMLS